MSLPNWARVIESEVDAVEGWERGGFYLCAVGSLPYPLSMSLQFTAKALILFSYSLVRTMEFVILPS